MGCICVLGCASIRARGGRTGCLLVPRWKVCTHCGTRQHLSSGGRLSTQEVLFLPYPVQISNASLSMTCSCPPTPPPHPCEFSLQCLCFAGFHTKQAEDVQPLPLAIRGLPASLCLPPRGGMECAVGPVSALACVVWLDRQTDWSILTTLPALLKLAKHKFEYLFELYI